MATVSISAGSVSYGSTNGNSVWGTGNAAFGIFAPVYKGGDGLWYPSKALVDQDHCTGISLGSCLGVGGNVNILEFELFSGQPFILNIGSGLTRAMDYFIAAAGGFCPRGDLLDTNYLTYFGTAISTSSISIRPNRTGITVA